jgi:hypothetical protein
MVHPCSFRLNEAVAIVLIGDLIPVCRRTLKRHALGQALKVIFDTFALGKWTIIACLTHVNMRK